MGQFGTGRFASISQQDVHNVGAAGDVAAVIARMVADLRARPGEWENHTLERFLEALAGYLGDQQPQSAEWSLFAEALVAATGYE